MGAALVSNKGKGRTAPAAWASHRSPSRMLPKNSRVSMPVSQRTANVSARSWARAGLSAATVCSADIALDACSDNAGDGATSRGSISYGTRW